MSVINRYDAYQRREKVMATILAAGLLVSALGIGWLVWRSLPAYQSEAQITALSWDRHKILKEEECSTTTERVKDFDGNYKTRRRKSCSWYFRDRVSRSGVHPDAPVFPADPAHWDALLQDDDTKIFYETEGLIVLRLLEPRNGDSQKHKRADSESAYSAAVSQVVAQQQGCKVIATISRGGGVNKLEVNCD